MNAGVLAAGWGERLGRKQPKALVPVGGRALIDFVLEGLEAAGARRVTCIVNDAGTAVIDHVARSERRLEMDWIVETTPSSMHSFLRVLERLACTGDSAFFITTVDGVCPPETYAQFAHAARVCSRADVVLGLTDIVEDEKPLWVALRGTDGGGLLPERIGDEPAAFEITALGSHGPRSRYVTSGFYWVRPSALHERNTADARTFTALRQYLGHLLDAGYSMCGVPLPPIIDVDRPEDIVLAEKLLCR